MLELEALQDIKVADETYTMAALIGCIESFDIQSDNWLDYIERGEGKRNVTHCYRRRGVHIITKPNGTK